MDKIPKIIHYCWFGNKDKPKLVKKCIKSWKKYLPEYEIIEWNESNFDINSNLYVKQAYEAGKYAFVSDYVRLYALCSQGGIYMDTDVEVIKPLDSFLKNEAFVGFESIDQIQTAIMACKKGCKIFKEFLDEYKNYNFIKIDGNYDLTPNVVRITNICEKYGIKKDNSLQVVNGLIIYPKTFFCPLNFNNYKSDFSDETYTIHHFAGSWFSEEEKKRIEWIKKYSKRKEFLCRFLSEDNANLILDSKSIIKNKINIYLSK